MEFESIIDYEENTEEISIIYSWDEYKNLTAKNIYPESYFNSIDVDHGGIRHHYFIEHSIQTPAFYFFCDLMSVDMDKLVQELSLYLRKQKKCNYMEIKKIISGYSVGLSESETIENIMNFIADKSPFKANLSIEEKLYSVFSKIITLQFYVQELYNIDKLENASSFKLFAYQMLDVVLEPYQPADYEVVSPVFLLKEYVHLTNKERKERILSFLSRFSSQIEKRGTVIQTFNKDLVNYLCMTFYQLLDKGYLIKKCENCGKYFVPFNRSDTLYCDRFAPQDNNKTCKEYGASKTYLENLKNDKAKGLFRKIYMAKQMLAKRNPDSPEYAESFEKYKTQSKQWKAEVKAGTKTEQEYIDWLKAVKEKKVL